MATIWRPDDDVLVVGEHLGGHSKGWRVHHDLSCMLLGEFLRDLSGRDDHPPGVLPDADEHDGAIYTSWQTQMSFGGGASPAGACCR